MWFLDESRSFQPLRIAVLTISDTRTLQTDRSGDTLVSLLQAAGHTLAARTLVQDDAEAIRAALTAWIDEPSIHVILSTGGTGITARDITPEVFASLYDKEIPGFGEIFRMLSYAKIGTSALQSRATAGIAKRTLLFALPGSPSAVSDAWEGILRFQLDSRHRPCNFVDLLDRL